MERFELKEAPIRHSSKSNLSGLNVQNCLPKKISWNDFTGIERSIECEEGVVAKQLKNTIGVIAAPYVARKNSAYLVTPENVLIAKLPLTLEGQTLAYYDILVRSSELIFLASSNNGDIQISVAPEDGSISSIKEFR